MKIKNCKALKWLVNSAVFTALFTAAAFSKPIEDTVYTRDNIPISCERYENGSEKVIIIVPGFYNSKKNRWMRKTVEMVSSNYDVIIFDLRGHGSSGGKYTWSARENMDVDAVIDYAKKKGYKKIGILAFSLGASSAINAVSEGNDVDSMVLISPLTAFEHIDFHFWEPGMIDDWMDNVSSGWDGKGAKTESIFLPKTKPVDSIKNIKKIPILFIHGDSDWVVEEHHSEKLFAAAPGPKRLEIIKGGLHAERLIQKNPDEMKKLIMEWFDETLKD